MIVELLITCWVILMADGSVRCYCEGEQPPEPTEVVEVADEYKIRASEYQLP